MAETRRARRSRLIGERREKQARSDFLGHLADMPSDAITAPEHPWVASAQEVVRKIPDPIGFLDPVENIMGDIAYGGTPDALDVGSLLMDLTPQGKGLGALGSAIVPAARRWDLAGKAAKKMDTPAAAKKRREYAKGVLSNPIEYQEPPSNSWLVDRSSIQDAMEGHPGVEQVAIERAQPGPRMAQGTVNRPWASKENVDLIRQQVERGRGASGESWYQSTYPLRQEMESRGGNFDDFAWANAITSPQSSVPVNLPTATAVMTLQRRGEPMNMASVNRLHQEMEDKYGPQKKWFLSQGRLDQYQDYLENGAPSGASSAEKITSYGEGLRGNLQNIPMDTHELAGTSFGSSIYPYWKGEGSVPTGLYGPYEDQYRSLLLDMDLQPSSGQASRWVGGGELTGLRTAPGTFLDIGEQVARYTARERGDPTKQGAYDALIKGMMGEEPLMPVYSRKVLGGVNPADFR